MLKRIINAFLTTFTLVSRIPIGRSIHPEYRYTVLFLPLIGLIVVFFLAVAAILTRFIIDDAFLVSIVALIVQYAFFNIFHFDGLLDSADALIVFADREKRLRILKDIKIGSFAFFVGVIYVVAKLYLLFRGVSIAFESGSDMLSRLQGVLLLFAYAVSGRAAAAVLPCLLSPARPGGLGKLIAGSRFSHALAGIVLAVVPIAALWVFSPGAASSNGWWPLLVFLSIPVAALLSGIPYKRKIGGYTGDALGLAVEIGEVIHLLFFYLTMRGVV